MSIQALRSGLAQAAKQTVAPIAKEATKKGMESARDKALTRFGDDLAKGPTLKMAEGKKIQSSSAKVKHAAVSVAKWAIPIVASAALAVGTQAVAGAILA